MAASNEFNSLDDFLREINTKAFRKGVEASIRRTRKGEMYECAFSVEYDPDSRMTVYPLIVTAGEKTEVSERKSVTERQRFEGMSDEDIIAKSIEDREAAGFMEYPSSYFGKSQTNIDEQKIVKVDMFGLLNLISFHTHPYIKGMDNMGVSKQDFRSANQEYRENFESYGFDAPTPLSVIVRIDSLEKNRKKFPAIAFREKGIVPLGYDFDFGSASSWINLSNEEALLKCVFGKKKAVEIHRLFLESYEVLKGEYEIGNGFSFR